MGPRLPWIIPSRTKAFLVPRSWVTAATGLAVALTPTALAQSTAGGETPQTNPLSVKQDPTVQYSKPPFKKQTQP